jgi:hypothetical protein
MTGQHPESHSKVNLDFRYQRIEKLRKGGGLTAGTTTMP